MESRWILFPGQTLSNTKISERHHALHIKAKNWGNITRHLDRKKIIQETIDKEESWKSYLRDGSKKMMENWQNSLEVGFHKEINETFINLLIPHLHSFSVII